MALIVQAYFYCISIIDSKTISIISIALFSISFEDGTA